MENDHSCMLSRTQQRLSAIENKLISRQETNKYRPAEPRKQNFSQDGEIERLREVISNLTQEKESLQHNLEEKIERLSYLEESVAMIESAMEKRTEDLFQVDEASCELSQKVSDLNMKLFKTVSDRDLLAEENVDLKSQLLACEEEIKTLSRRLEEYRDAFTTMETQHETSTISDGHLVREASIKIPLLKALTTEIRHEEMSAQSSVNI